MPEIRKRVTVISSIIFPGSITPGSAFPQLSALESTAGAFPALDDAHGSSARPAGDGIAQPPVLRELEFAAAAVAGHSDRALPLAVSVGSWLPAPGTGQTLLRWEVLRALAIGDLTAARVVEAHTDALAILAEAAADSAVDDVALAQVDAGQSSTWGVFAAEGPGVRVEARRDGHRWMLSGIKPWCSLADRLSHALVTAHTGDGSRRLFAINLRTPAVRSGDDGWVARGLVDVPSGPIELTNCPAVPVGPDDWYLRRPGFAWGGIGVAACWLGGAVGLGRTLRAASLTKAPDQVGAMHLGAVDVALFSADSVLAAAAAAVDAGAAAGQDGVLLALRVRTLVAGAAEETLTRTGHALGPAPLARDERHARRVADLQLYLRQHHAERDQAALGRAALDLLDWP
ncbi:MAG: acyl-CoA dehydrogenase [Nakamurella sp.]